MLTHQRKPVCLSLISTDLPIWSVVKPLQHCIKKDSERFHLLLTEPPGAAMGKLYTDCHPRLLWLEISLSGNYDHAGERSGELSSLLGAGIYGLSRYWLGSESLQGKEQIRLRNFTPLKPI